MKQYKYIFVGILFFLGRTSAFSQFIKVTPDSIDLGNVPTSTYQHVAMLCGVYGLTNISDSILLVYPPVTSTNSGPSLIIPGQSAYEPFHLHPGQTWYGYLDFTSEDTGVTRGYVLIWYDTPSGMTDSIVIPVKGIAVHAIAPFMSSFRIGTQFIPPCAPAQWETNVLGFISHSLAIANPTEHFMQVDSIVPSGDIDTLGFNIPKTPISLNPHASSGWDITFHSRIIGNQTARIKVYYSYTDDSITNPQEMVMDSVLTGNTQYVYDAIVLTGDAFIVDHSQDEIIIDKPTPVGQCSNPDSGSYNAAISIYNYGTIGLCGDSTTFHVDFVGARKDAFSVVDGPASFTLPSINNSNPDASGGVAIQYCPKVPAYHADSNDPDGYVYDSVRVIADYADGTHDTSYMKIATHTPVVSGVAEPVPPGAFTLHNYPNPFTNATHISIDAPLPADARVIVTDMLGRQVADLGRTAGARELEWTPEPSVPSGTYFLIVKTPARETAKPMLLMR
jgi:hypothetical protein